jgi:hypothetical protein
MGTCIHAFRDLSEIEYHTFISLNVSTNKFSFSSGIMLGLTVDPNDTYTAPLEAESNM